MRTRVVHSSPSAKSPKKPRNRCTFNSLGRKFLWSVKVRLGIGVLKTTGSLRGGVVHFFKNRNQVTGG